MFSATDWVRVALVLVATSSLSLVFVVSVYSKLGFQNRRALDEMTSIVTNTTFNVTDLQSSLTVTKSPQDKERASCRKVMMVIAKRLMKVLNGCTKELKEQFTTREEFHKHFQCSIKCFMIKTNMIDKSFRFSNATFNTFLIEQIPTSYHSLAFKLTYQCVIVFAEKITGVGDPYCENYGNFVKCLQAEVADQCTNNLKI